MRKLLHIVASPREEESRTLQVSEKFLEAIRERYPECLIDELNLAKEELPQLSAKRVDGKYTLLAGKELYGSLREAWNEILQHIDRFMSADLYLISTPMWNFSIPYMLKQYIDLIIQPKYLFRYTESASVEGLVKNKKMIVITSRGGQYKTDELKKMDFQEPYLRAIFGFVGLNDMTFINAEPMDMGQEKEKKSLQEAFKAAKIRAREL